MSSNGQILVTPVLYSNCVSIYTELDYRNMPIMPQSYFDPRIYIPPNYVEASVQVEEQGQIFEQAC